MYEIFREAEAAYDAEGPALTLAVFEDTPLFSDAEYDTLESLGMTDVDLRGGDPDALYEGLKAAYEEDTYKDSAKPSQAAGSRASVQSGILSAVSDVLTGYDRW